MAPIRRYLRITKFSVLEVRIYVDNPALTHTWLLNSRNPILPRVIESVRPLVLPKLREEKERALSRKKSSKKKGIKDVVVEDDFEVSVFLTETPTRHSILTKHKHFRDKTTGKLASNSTKLISETNDAPFDVDAKQASEPIILQEEDDNADAGAILDQIPAVGDEASAQLPRRSKRQRTTRTEKDDDSEEDLFVASDEDDDGPSTDAAPIEIDSDADDAPPPKRRRKHKPAARDAEDAEDAAAGAGDDKKKLAMDISFEGFAIYGRVLCLVVKKREGALRTAGAGTTRGAASDAAGSSNNKPAGQAMMENWISSTQMPNPGAEEQADT
ncbi:hypothetical protein B0T11DRAFT_64783 [Plectosphaerella cucumerina]|uniref:Uncharacterized protein n=1 Tax=Plectosphaerella cucumerina TaxID=40658 RepID=A0A8K0TPS9_9PEZI|nr:hypothetical protein B0T11DRAFT_64783 [Plectosphaerella cucumerina]